MRYGEGNALHRFMRRLAATRPMSWVRERKIPNGTSGSRARNSTRTNAASSATEPSSSARVVLSPKPSRSPRLRA